MDRMTTRQELEENIKGTITSHEKVSGIPVAFGVEETENGDKPIAYIYNLPRDSIDRGFLAVRASENGGTKPVVAQPNAIEYVVGFEGEYGMNKSDLREICEETIADLDISTGDESASVIDLRDSFD